MGYIRKLNDSVNIIGTNLRKYRIQNNYSQEDLCKKTSIIRVDNVSTRYL